MIQISGDHQSQHVTILPPCGDSLKYTWGKYEGIGCACSMYISAWQLTRCMQTGLGRESKHGHAPVGSSNAVGEDSEGSCASHSHV